MDNIMVPGIVQGATRNLPTPCKSCGFTLVELGVTLSIVAILVTTALPQFDRMRRTTAQRAAVNDFMHSVFLARSQAIMINKPVSICRSADGEHCGNRESGWEQGWIVFENLDRDQPAERDRDERVIQRHAGWQGGQITSNRLSFSFRPTAQGDVTGTIVFCHPHGDDADARAIIISLTGRPRVSPRDASNRPLSC